MKVLMKRAKIFFAALLISLAAVVASAQNISVSGVVTDAATGETVIEANVRLKGSSTVYTMTNFDGKYTISVPSNAVLEISILGYKTAEVAVAGRSQVNVALEFDSDVLDETIVVAYGVQKKSSFVGAATQLSGEKLEKMQTSNITKSLEGAVAGLQVASSSGTPGSGSSIQIRGFGSVNASTSPLIVVDGVPYEGSLNSIPAQDIESLTVLKDAAANSMYGARGSNGVIIITTKRGGAGKVNISFDAKYGVNSRAVPTYDVISNPSEYYEMSWEAIRNALTGLDAAQRGITASATLFDNLGPYNIYKNVADAELIDPSTGKINPNATERKWADDWNRDVFRPGARQEYSLAASGGSENTQGYFSLAYLDDAGYVPTSAFKRISMRAKVDHRVRDFIKAGINIAYSNTTQSQYSNSEQNNYGNLFMFTQSIAPIYPIYLYDADGVQQKDASGRALYDWGETGRAFAPSMNPFGQLMASQYSTVRDNISSRGYLNVDILKDLVFSANVAFDVFNTKTIAYTTPAGGDAKAVGGRGNHDLGRYTALNANQLLTWTPTFGENNLNVLLGHEIKSDTSYSLESEMTKFVDPNVPDFNNAIVYQGLYSASSSYFLEGFFGRAEYNYAGKYYLSASYRVDGSSRFAPEKRWGDFWAVGASWNAKQESFLQDVAEINYLKVKASFGTQGNDNIGYTKVYENLYQIDRVDGEAALTQTFRAAPEVSWEKSNNFNVGFETKIFDRVAVNFDYFIKETKDMIYSRPLPLSQGKPSTQLVNDMDMMNKGIEFEISADIIKNRDFSWNVSLNGTHYKNSITRLPSDYPVDGKQVGNYWRELGSPLYTFYLYEYAGVDPKTGSPLYNKYTPVLDENGKPTGEETCETVTTSSEATYRKTGKSSIPDLYGGFSTSIKIKNFDISANFAYQIGGYTIDSQYQELMSGGEPGQNWHRDIFKRWTPDNTETSVPAVRMNYNDTNAMSDRWLTKASYFSIRNVTIGYTLPKKVCDALTLEGARVYLTGDNLFYTSARRGLDVRRSFSGTSQYYTYSALRTISAGVSITF